MDLEKIPEPIFVVGPPRSGTTLVGKILGGQHDICRVGESHFFEGIWARRRELGTLETRDEIANAVSIVVSLYQNYNFADARVTANRIIDSSRITEEVYSNGGGYITLYLCFFGSFLRENGKHRICDDTPKNLYYLKSIFELFPKSKAVVCIRDPRDFICSYKNTWQISGRRNRMTALYHPILTSMVWRSSSITAKMAASTYSPERITLVKYEDLVNEPNEQVRKLCQFLEVDMSPEMLDIDDHNSSFSDSPSGIFTTSIGRWVRCLESYEAWWAQRINSDIMAGFGYKLSRMHPRIRTLIKDIISFPLSFMRAMYSNRHSRVSTLSYLKQRLRSI